METTGLPASNQDFTAGQQRRRMFSASRVEATSDGPYSRRRVIQLRDVADAVICFAACNKNLAIRQQRCRVKEARSSLIQIQVTKASGKAPCFRSRVVQFCATGSVEEAGRATCN